MPETFYLRTGVPGKPYIPTNAEIKAMDPDALSRLEIAYRCQFCGKQFHGEQYDLAEAHEQMPAVPGRDFHDVVLMKSGDGVSGYVLFVRNGARAIKNGEKEKHETLYAECEVDMSRIWPQDNEFARSVATMSSAEIECEIGKNLRPASLEEMKNLNDAVFRRDYGHVHENFFGARSFRTLPC